jgi:hypothetical protein
MKRPISLDLFLQACWQPQIVIIYVCDQIRVGQTQAGVTRGGQPAVSIVTYVFQVVTSERRDPIGEVRLSGILDNNNLRR